MNKIEKLGTVALAVLIGGAACGQTDMYPSPSLADRVADLDKKCRSAEFDAQMKVAFCAARDEAVAQLAAHPEKKAEKPHLKIERIEADKVDYVVVLRDTGTGAVAVNYAFDGQRGPPLGIIFDCKGHYMNVTTAPGLFPPQPLPSGSVAEEIANAVCHYVPPTGY